MEDLKFLKEYIVDTQKSDNIYDKGKRNIFYKVGKEEIVNAENRMKRKFPNELKLFYQEIGYGFLCKDDKTHTNRIMHPSDIADFYCEDEVYDHVDRDLYESNEMIFFDLGGDGNFITLNIEAGDDFGKVYYFGIKIANFLNDFIINMYKETNYYMKMKM